MKIFSSAALYSAVKKIFSFAAATCCALVVASCETQLTGKLEAASRDPSFDRLTTYQKALALDYLRLAKEFNEKNLSFVGEKLARRGLESTRGKTPAPRSPFAPLSTAGYAQDYGFMLHLTKNPGDPRLYPEKAAKTMALYDCRYATLDKSAECRNAFHAAMDETFEELAKATLRGAVTVPSEAANVPVSTKKEPTTPLSFNPEWAYFLPGTSALPQGQRLALTSYAEKLAQDGPCRISLRGYIDAKNGAAKNKTRQIQLALARALAVKRIFVEAGIEEEAVEAVAFDEGWLPEEKNGENGRPEWRRAVEIRVVTETGEPQGAS
ncbi:MAG: OmpA family protein [Rickettsiales bacterium]